MDCKITCIPGDGIGPEIVAEAKKVLQKTAEKYGHAMAFEDVLMGGASIDVHGIPLTDETIEKCKAADAVLMGSIGGNTSTSPWYQLPPEKRPEAGLLKLRKSLNLFANLRPAYLYEELAGACPLNVKEAVRYLNSHYNMELLKKLDEDLSRNHKAVRTKGSRIKTKTLAGLQFKNIWFRYEKNGKDILRGAGLTVLQNTLHCLLGGNGSGKSTLLSVIGGLYKPYRGHMDRQSVAYMCQTPQFMFLKETVYEDFLDTGYQNGRTKQETEELIKQYEGRLGLGNLYHMHPYDLSGGEIQKAALMKILLSRAEIILLDEPTKGMDAVSKEEFGQVLKDLLSQGKTILMVTHDIEFAAEYGDYCSMIFDGEIFGTSEPVEFFEHNTYFTTYTGRILRKAAGKRITVSQADELLNYYEKYKEVGT